MFKTLCQLLTAGRATPRELFPPLPDYSRGLPELTPAPCTGCDACARACPTLAITVDRSLEAPRVTLDRGLCITCGLCAAVCPTGTIVESRSTAVSVSRREDLVLTSDGGGPAEPPDGELAGSPFQRSLHVRVVSTGESAADLEVAAVNNPIFDASRFGIHFVASPRFADALIVTGPVPRAMQQPLRRCYDAMAEPRLVIAVGASAISGGVHRGGYAAANGAAAVLPVDVYVPGNPPHPWSILHGLLLGIGANHKDRETQRGH